MSSKSESMCKIRDFTAFLEKSLGQRIVEYSLKPLTKPGDNYGSVMLSVEVEVAETNDSNKNKTMNLVAKTAITNPFLVSIFQPDVTFVKEAHFYSDIIPAMKHFERDSNVPENDRIDAFIRCLGSRLSLDPNAKCADADAVILLENIKIANYKNIDQREGFDTDESLAIIKQLAKFHSLCIAMRRTQPKMFKTKIEPFLAPVHKILNLNDKQATMADNICEGVRYIKDLDPKLRGDIERQLRLGFDIMIKERSTLSLTTFTTVIHKDFWSTNLMIQRNDTNDSLKIKMYDFQMYCLGSFAVDLVLFLFTSVNPDELSKNFQLFIKNYHMEFVKMLDLVNCPRDDFTFDKMWDEIQDQIKSKFIFILYMLKIIFMQKEAPSSYDDVTHDTFLKEGQPSAATLKRWQFIINFFEENGFLACVVYVV